jgi:hypothetical protein
MFQLAGGILQLWICPIIGCVGGLVYFAFVRLLLRWKLPSDFALALLRQKRSLTMRLLSVVVRRMGSPQMMSKWRATR